MRSGLVQTGAWAAATGAAVLFSWLGVNAVLSGAALESPQTLSLPAPADSASPPAPTTGPASPPVASTDPAQATGAAAPAAGPSSDAQATSGAPTREATATTVTSSAPPTAGSVQSYPVPGGRVALDMRPDSAELVSATPDPGWQMQMWHGDQWLRVDFSRDNATNSVFVTWNGHPPDVQTVVR